MRYINLLTYLLTYNSGRVKVMTPICFVLIISETAGDSDLVTMVKPSWSAYRKWAPGNRMAT